PPSRHRCPSRTTKSTPSVSSSPSSFTDETDLTGRAGSSTRREDSVANRTVDVVSVMGVPAASRTAADTEASSESARAVSDTSMLSAARSARVASGSSVMTALLGIASALEGVQAGRQVVKRRLEPRDIRDRMGVRSRRERGRLPRHVLPRDLTATAGDIPNDDVLLRERPPVGLACRTERDRLRERHTNSPSDQAMLTSAAARFAGRNTRPTYTFSPRTLYQYWFPSRRLSVQR